MQLFMRWLQSTADASTGLVTQDGLADWCPPADVDTEPAQVSSFSQLLGYRMLAQAADALGKHDDAARARAWLQKLVPAYTAHYYNASSATYQDGAAAHGAPNVQTSNGMALFLGVPSASERARVVASLVADVRARAHHLSTGIIGTRVLLDALSLSRETETAYKVAVQDTYPGHGHFVRQNATTLWERWEATAHDPTGGSSMHHTGLRREALFGPGQSAVYGGGLRRRRIFRRSVVAFYFVFVF